MVLEKGDMWSVFNTAKIFMITTNPIRRKDGAVVMGRGIAREAKERFPDLPYHFGRRLESNGNQFVGCISDPIWYFMVKDHWAQPAKLEIIDASVEDCLYKFNEFDGMRVDLNFPGIGNGQLSREDVLPLMERLPDNFHIWEK